MASGVSVERTALQSGIGVFIVSLQSDQSG